MKNRPNTSELIVSTLDSDYNEKQRLMDISEITAKIFKEGYLYGGKEVQFILEDRIRRNMGHALELASENKVPKTIIPGRKPTSKDPTIKIRIIGYKILAPGDEKLVLDELMYKQRNGEARTKSYNRLAESAKEKGVLPEELIKELT